MMVHSGPECLYFDGENPLKPSNAAYARTSSWRWRGLLLSSRVLPNRISECTYGPQVRSAMNLSRRTAGFALKNAIASQQQLFLDAETPLHITAPNKARENFNNLGTSM